MTNFSKELLEAIRNIQEECKKAIGLINEPTELDEDYDCHAGPDDGCQCPRCNEFNER